MKGNNGKSEWENESGRLKRKKKKKKKGDSAIVFHITEVITWAWPLPIGYCLPLFQLPC